MADINDTIAERLKQAMKDRNTTALNALRAVKTALRYKEVEIAKPLEEEHVLQALRKEARKREDAAAEYRKYGRDDLALKEDAELAIILEFMPGMMTEEHIMEAARKAIAETGAASPREIGKVMKALMPELKGKADGKTVNAIVSKLLSG
ncbi:MAG: GatB/YqeY domain-containing protein [bacterium]